MIGAISAKGWLAFLTRQWLLYHLENQHFRFMFAPPPGNEWVALDCETTGLDVNKDEIIAIAAMRIVGNRVMTSERLELLVRPERRVSADSVRIHQLREQDVARGMAPEVAMTQLMHFIGSRPLVGYYLEFDIAMIDLPQRNAHDALNDAIMAALAFVKLKQLLTAA